MLINYDRNRALTIDQKLQSLIESIQRALDEANDKTIFGKLAFKERAEGRFTPEGTVSAPTITVNPTTETVYSITNVGTLPALSASVSNKNLQISWSAGTLPTKGTGQSVLKGVTATASAPVFTGTEGTVVVK